MAERRTIGTPEWTSAALAAVAAFRAKTGADILCPTCAAPGIAIADRSVPPHAMWYVLSCSACGLDHTLHIPMAAPPMSFD